MYAVIGRDHFDVSRVKDIRKIVEDKVLPGVRALDGFVSATFLHAVDERDTGTAVLIFESEDAARAALARLAAVDAGGLVASHTLEINEVVGQS
ncbi:hypothetical protein GCM10014715_26720 [Streptomyces spiralis]|uniref:ABM domain-containing protein n=1 Tax=Streptomyces spiralis TaxID=66376 RepID=A0A918ZUP1_9ACTN|nr:hypothetical protein [Streptomyces spiralis]GHE71372.1 hypothetical protein GCM10014715_26720 [Streptomyces spiralis]